MSHTARPPDCHFVRIPADLFEKKFAKIKIRNFRKDRNCDFAIFATFANNTIWFWKGDRNFANKTIGFWAHFTTLRHGLLGWTATDF